MSNKFLGGFYCLSKGSIGHAVLTDAYEQEFGSGERGFAMFGCIDHGGRKTIFNLKDNLLMHFWGRKRLGFGLELNFDGI